MVNGTKTLYASADGSIVLGGSLTGYDILVGIRPFQASAGNPMFQGTFFIVGVEDDASLLPFGISAPDAYYGSGTFTAQGTALAALRFNPNDHTPYDFTSADQLNLGADGTRDGESGRFYVGAGSRVTLDVGRSYHYSLELGVQPRTLPKVGSVYLNPLGVVNAASYAPFTNPITGGELLDLYGEGLSSVTLKAQTLPLPTILGGVQVSVNGRPAPILSVSTNPNAPSLVIVVPFGTTEAYATIQVTNSGTKSNPVTVYTSRSAPGMFSVGASGVGAGVITHADGSLVTSAKPAHVGETVVAYATGLGAVTPAVADGAAAPSKAPLAIASGVNVYIDSQQAKVAFAGLAPGFVGLYQINVQVPQQAGPGDVSFDIEGTDAYHTQTTISIQ